jgi:hypothetical protein
MALMQVCVHAAKAMCGVGPLRRFSKQTDVWNNIAQNRCCAAVPTQTRHSPYPYIPRGEGHAGTGYDSLRYRHKAVCVGKRTRHPSVGGDAVIRRPVQSMTSTCIRSGTNCSGLEHDGQCFQIAAILMVLDAFVMVILRR